jgi:hypothetical protein
MGSWEVGVDARPGAYVVASKGSAGWSLESGDEGVYVFATREDAQTHIDRDITYYLGYFKTEEAGRAAYTILRLEVV